MQKFWSTLEEIIRFHHSKLSLQLNIQFDSGHNCDICERDLEEGEREILDNLVELENKIQDETMFSIISIAGYIQQKMAMKAMTIPSFITRSLGTILIT